MYIPLRCIYSFRKVSTDSLRSPTSPSPCRADMPTKPSNQNSPVVVRMRRKASAAQSPGFEPVSSTNSSGEQLIPQKETSSLSVRQFHATSYTRPLYMPLSAREIPMSAGRSFDPCRIDALIATLTEKLVSSLLLSVPQE